MPRIQNHCHKLKRYTYPSTGSKVFFCVLDCGFKVDQGLALGKKTICWRCGKETVMNEYSIRLARPTCPDCKKSKNEIAESVQTPTIETISQAVAVSESSSLSDRLKKLTFSPPETKIEEI